MLVYTYYYYSLYRTNRHNHITKFNHLLPHLTSFLESSSFFIFYYYLITRNPSKAEPFRVFTPIRFSYPLHSHITPASLVGWSQEIVCTQEDLNLRRNRKATETKALTTSTNPLELFIS
jgi:hypothetical protein